MKKIFLLLIIVCCFFATPLKADEVDLNGNSSADLTRSLIKPILAFINDQTLEVDFNSTVGTVVVSIYDEMGNFVYQQSVNGTAGQQLLIDISGLDTGNYTIEIQNSQTDLSGNFEI